MRHPACQHPSDRRGRCRIFLVILEAVVGTNFSHLRKECFKPETKDYTSLHAEGCWQAG